ncbi:MAG: single-stranded-DNA-specific exonuclease RecJ [Thermodesulfobacteriota bacterium]
MPRRWIRRNDRRANPASADWAVRLGISERLAGLLWDRGLDSLAAMDVFLSPHLRHLAPLEDWPGLDAAARILAEGLAAGRKLAVWGDYDVDGVTSTALVSQVLAGRGTAVETYLPDRTGEGYGLNCAGIEALAARGAQMLLTVDCGISDVAEVRRAKELGLTVVVCDHHLPGPELPPADAVLDPRLCECPCADLAGVGVAFLLMAAVNRLLPGEPVDMREVLDLVAVGSIADVVKLTGQNRILVKNGLLKVAEARRPGLAALKDVGGFSPTASLGAGQVGFSLAPRINAAGRLGSARDALDLLLAPDHAAAAPLAKRLDELNGQRQRTEETILKEALEQAAGRLDKPGLVLFAPHWHAGVIGIVASRVVEAHYRPTLILTRDGDRLKGSGRSTEEADLHGALAACAHLLAGFGGHRQAAGLSIAPENLEALEAAFCAAVAAQIGPEPLAPTLRLDGELPFADVGFDLLKELELLQPFGPGNPEPTFFSPPVRVSGHKVFGKGHVRLTLLDETSRITLAAKAWRQADTLPRTLQGSAIQVAFRPRIDRYSGIPTIELDVKDWREPQFS